MYVIFKMRLHCSWQSSLIQWSFQKLHFVDEQQGDVNDRLSTWVLVLHHRWVHSKIWCWSLIYNNMSQSAVLQFNQRTTFNNCTRKHRLLYFHEYCYLRKELIFISHDTVVPVYLQYIPVHVSCVHSLASWHGADKAEDATWRCGLQQEDTVFDLHGIALCCSSFLRV